MAKPKTLSKKQSKALESFFTHNLSTTAGDPVRNEIHARLRYQVLDQLQKNNLETNPASIQVQMKTLEGQFNYDRTTFGKDSISSTNDLIKVLKEQSLEELKTSLNKKGVNTALIDQLLEKRYANLKKIKSGMSKGLSERLASVRTVSIPFLKRSKVTPSLETPSPRTFIALLKESARKINGSEKKSDNAHKKQKPH